MLKTFGVGDKVYYMSYGIGSSGNKNQVSLHSRTVESISIHGHAKNAPLCTIWDLHVDYYFKEQWPVNAENGVRCCVFNTIRSAKIYMKKHKLVLQKICRPGELEKGAKNPFKGCHK